MELVRDVTSNVIANVVVGAPGKAWIAFMRSFGIIKADGPPAEPGEALWKAAGRRILAFGRFVVAVMLAVSTAYFLACLALGLSIRLFRWGNGFVRWATTPSHEPDHAGAISED